jgi:transcriptional regulator GlxA family with amidase domain
MRRIAYLVIPDFQVMVFAGTTVFEMANRVAGHPVYDVIMLSEHGGPVPSSLGIAIDTRAFDAEPLDTVIACAGFGAIDATPGVQRYIRQAMTTARRVGAICTGAFVLAQAGVLAGRRVTTHWGCAAALQASYPDVKVEEDRIFVATGRYGRRPA